jgi:ADP-ribosyl-[dinitrogen reductase] hydrolase
MSSNGKCFDIGITVSNALRNYLNTKEPYSGSVDEYSAGNGSIMRLSPIPIFFHNNYEDCIKYAGESSRTTHGSDECVDSCRLFTSLLFNAFRASDKLSIFANNTYQPYCKKVISIANKDFLKFDYSQLTGSGYVIESLESALWCFMKGESFEDCILLAANIGNDADTTAAICGQLAGAYYGFSNIPSHWRSSITMATEIEDLAVELFRYNND